LHLRDGNRDLTPVVEQEMTSDARVRWVLGVVTVAALVTTAGCSERDASPVATPSTTIAHSTATVAGIVTAAPTCPVERINQPCPPRPVSAEIDARTQAGKKFTATHTDPDGHYTLMLPLGTFILTVQTPGLPRCPPTPVTVRSALRITADIHCDTGIR
jgi:hypothetical protein